jgi:hypothetical protein
VSSQTVSASTNAPSMANAAENADSGTPAAAFADPSTGSITRVSGAALSTQPVSSVSTLTGRPSRAARIAVSTMTSIRMVGVPSAPSATISASAVRSWSPRAVAYAVNAAAAATRSSGCASPGQIIRALP